MAETKSTKSTKSEKDKMREHNREMVTIRLFKDTGKYTNDLYVNVNDHNYIIKRGVEVQVPRYIADVIANSEKQDRNTAMMIERANSEYDSALQKGLI